MEKSNFEQYVLLEEEVGFQPTLRFLHALNDFKSFPLKHLGTLPCTGIYLIVSPKFIPKLLFGYLGATQPPIILWLNVFAYTIVSKKGVVLDSNQCKQEPQSCA